MSTTKLYKNDRYLKDCEAVITSISVHEDASEGVSGDTCLLDVTLDRTLFFPEGGGQSCDTGTIGDWKVTDVQESGTDEVIHTILWINGTPRPEPGDSVRCLLDWDRRFDNMQRHCGEHILSGIFYDMFGGVNRGFHMGSEYMTIDISLEEPPGGYGICSSGSKADAESAAKITEITYEMALDAELEANKVIWSDAPVTVMHFDSREKAAGMPLRKALAFDEDISIVCVGSPNKASDCVACCGTHPSTAGQVGLIKIYKVEKYKSMFRIYFEAGRRALLNYDMKHSMLTELSDRYSSSIEDFPDKLRAQEQKLHDAKNALFHAKKALTEKECSQLDDILTLSEGPVILYAPAHFSLDDIFDMAKNYMDSGKGSRKKSTDGSGTAGTLPEARKLNGRLLMLYSAKDTSYILVSDGTPDCGSLVKEYASFYKGKGGGNAGSARAIFGTAEDADLFADLIRKHLK
ncbi:MAG: alanyl-tRNA editing protein [Anaerovoracaceae bacterium]